MRLTRRTLLAALPLTLPGLARAQSFAQRPIRLVVSFGPGGGADLIARLMAPTMAEQLGQQVVIENRAGAGGNVAATAVARSAPDGHTLLVTNPGPFSINQFIYPPPPPFVPERDLAGVVLMAEMPHVLVATRAVPVNTLAEMIAYAAANPARVNYGSGGIGSSGHLSFELLKLRTGMVIPHVPFRGSGDVMKAVLGGDVQFALDTLPVYAERIQDGGVRALAMGSARRAPTMPNLPTVMESGVADFTAGVWFGMAVPKATPRPVVAQLNAAARLALAKPDVVERLRLLGAAPMGGSAEDADRYFAQEALKWQDIAVRTNTRVE